MLVAATDRIDGGRPTVPEGDTVWRTALHLDRALTGSALVATDFRVPDRYRCQAPSILR